MTGTIYLPSVFEYPLSIIFVQLPDFDPECRYELGDHNENTGGRGGDLWSRLHVARCSP